MTASNSLSAVYFKKEHNYTDSSDAYWFVVSGKAPGSNYKFNKSVIGVTNGWMEPCILDVTGMIVNMDEATAVAIIQTCAITDEMKASPADEVV